MAIGIPKEPLSRVTGLRRLMRLFAVAVAGAMLAGCSHASRHSVPPATSTTVPRIVTTTTTVPFVIYRVRPGDTLTKIATRYRVSPSAIVDLNHITNPDLLAEGRELRIPPAPPLRLVVTPHTGTQGQAFHLKLTGAPPNDQINFEVHSPSGTFTGPAHTVPADGTVTATYQTGPADPAATYTVTARDRSSPLSNATFVVSAVARG
jgi:LysM repeat protein